MLNIIGILFRYSRTRSVCMIFLVGTNLSKFLLTFLINCLCFKNYLIRSLKFDPCSKKVNWYLSIQRTYLPYMLP